MCVLTGRRDDVDMFEIGQTVESWKGGRIAGQRALRRRPDIHTKMSMPEIR